MKKRAVRPPDVGKDQGFTGRGVWVRTAGTAGPTPLAGVANIAKMPAMGVQPGEPSAYCRGCGYSLVGLGEKHRCPECGRAFDLADSRTFRQRPRRRIWRIARWVAYPLLLATLVLAGWIGWLSWEWRCEQHAIAAAGVRVVGRDRFVPAWLVQSLGPQAYITDRATDVKPIDAEAFCAARTAHLKRLRHLRRLDLSEMSITDLSPVANITGLEDLVLCDTPVADVSPLADVRGLRGIFMNRTPVSDISPLKHLSGLQILDLRDTKVADLSPLAGLTELRCLILLRAPVDDRCLPVLKGLTKLEQVHLQATRVTPDGAAELRAALPRCIIFGP